jgi:hypothetical protein
MCKKDYALPQDIKDLFKESYAFRISAERFKDSLFGSYKKTIKALKQSINIERKAWDMIYNLYPELKGKNLSYNYIPQTLVIKGE